MTSIDPQVVRFVLTSIPSVPFLEALLLLQKETHGWDSAMLAARLYISGDRAAVLVQELVAAGMVEHSGSDQFHYAPQSRELDTLVVLTAESYRKHLVEITQLIHARADRAAHQFADAFRLRKDP